MTKAVFLLFVILLLGSCGAKQAQNLLYAGNYDLAIDNAIANLIDNKDKKSNQEFVVLLEQAFAKAKQQDKNAIQILDNDTSASRLEKIYKIYLQLNSRQAKIKTILPLKITKEDRAALFLFEDYSDELIDSRNRLTDHLYTIAKKNLLSKDKMSIRKAYNDLNYLNQLRPNFINVLSLMETAKIIGSDHFFLEIKNQTSTIIPIALQNDLLDFGNFGLDNKWTVYHRNKETGISYDYSLVIHLTQITISPKQTKEREFFRERIIKDGTKKLIDANGREVLDEKGKIVIVDNYKTVTARIVEFRQNKSCQINAKIECINLKNNQLLQSFPVNSEYIFENTFATTKGDKRAADDNYYSNFDKKQLPFPSNEEMIFNAVADLKSKIKELLPKIPQRK